MSFNVNLPLGRSGVMSGVTGLRLTSKDPQSLTSVSYDNSNRPVSATYLLVDATSETISLSYKADGWLVHDEIEYRNYQYDLFAATIIPVDTLATEEAKLDTQSQEDDKLCLLRSIDDGIKKMNMYFALITNTRI